MQAFDPNVQLRRQAMLRSLDARLPLLVLDDTVYEPSWKRPRKSHHEPHILSDVPKCVLPDHVQLEKTQWSE